VEERPVIRQVVDHVAVEYPVGILSQGPGWVESHSSPLVIADVLHITTHGVYPEDNPAFSRLSMKGRALAKAAQSVRERWNHPIYWGAFSIHGS